MPPPVILDPSTLNFAKLIADREAIRRVNPHRFEFALLDGLVYCDAQARIYAGYHDVREDAWWVRGHVPGRPLFPGVLMIEVAAQLSSYLTHEVLHDDRFVGFGGVDKVKFRGTVQPPCRFVVIGRGLEVRSRRSVSEVQGFVDRTMVFEGVVTGMAV